MQRLRFSNSQIDEVAFLISMHLRVGEYDEQWSDAAVRRLIRDTGGHLEDLIRLTQADKGAGNPAMPWLTWSFPRAPGKYQRRSCGTANSEPAGRTRDYRGFGYGAGAEIGRIKKYLESQIVEGNCFPVTKRRR